MSAVVEDTYGVATDPEVGIPLAIGICIFLLLFSSKFFQLRTAIFHSPLFYFFFSLSTCRYLHSTKACTNQMEMTDVYIEAR